MNLRDASEADLPAVVAIYNSTVDSLMVTADTQPVTVDSRRAWFHAHSPARHPLWVLEERGEILGWVSLQAFYGRPAYDATAEISIYVDERHRYCRLGQGLLDEAVSRTPQLEIKTLLGFIFAHNAPSLRLFERNGFQRWAHLPRVAELGGVERDLVIVGRRLRE
jgi:L-amino acid N-acyltransferase YncA